MSRLATQASFGASCSVDARACLPSYVRHLGPAMPARNIPAPHCAGYNRSDCISAWMSMVKMVDVQNSSVSGDDS